MLHSQIFHIFPVLYGKNTIPYVAIDKRDIYFSYFFTKTEVVGID